MLPVNLQSAAGSNASLTARATDRVWWDGMGLDGSQKCPLILFMLRYIKHYADFFKNCSQNHPRIRIWGLISR